MEDVPGDTAAAHADDNHALDVLASRETCNRGAIDESLLHLFGEGLGQVEHPIGVN